MSLATVARIPIMNVILSLDPRKDKVWKQPRLLGVSLATEKSQGFLLTSIRT